MRFFLFALFVNMVLWPGLCPADDARARQIMEAVEDRDDGDNQTIDMLMVLIDKNKKQRKKNFQNYSKDFGKDTKRIMFIKSPAQIKNTGFLTFDYDDEAKDDDQWLFLPAVGKTKRIATSDKSSSFMGSDLNYSDMTSRNLDDYNFSLLKESIITGQKVWIIESIPKSREIADEIGYTKFILAVGQDNYLVIRAKMWTIDGGYVKFLEAQKIELIDGIWVVTQTLVSKKRGKIVQHQTFLKFTNVKFNQDLDEDIFTIRRLEKGLF